jgi:hypothetical protein
MQRHTENDDCPRPPGVRPVAKTDPHTLDTHTIDHAEAYGPFDETYIGRIRRDVLSAHPPRT